MIRKILAGVIVTSLLILPVLASDSSEGVDSNAEIQTVEGEEGFSSEPDAEQAAENSTDLSEVTANQKTINDNIVFLAACIISTGGLLVGYCTGKDLLDFLW